MSKRLIFSILLLKTAEALATEVMAYAEGASYEEALSKAKIIAIEKANGTWIKSTSSTDGYKYKEKIIEYGGGFIKSYEVIESGINFVKIKANVERGERSVQTNSAAVPAAMFDELKHKKTQQENLKKAIAELDNRAEAIAFKITKIEYLPDNAKTLVVIEGDAQIQESWYNEYKNLSQAADQLIQLESFYKPLKVFVTANSYGTAIFTKKITFYDNLEIYYPGVQGVKLNPDKTDRLKLKILVETNNLSTVNSFQVRFE
jgi:hypothetical protein